MLSFESRMDERKKTFKKGVDGDDARRRREDEALSLRKAKKDEQLRKKRMMVDPENKENGQENMAPAFNAPQAKQCEMAGEGLAELRTRLQVPTLSAEERLLIVTDIRKRLSRASNPPTQEAIDAGLIPLMVQYMGGADTKLQFEASWVLTNIASGDSEQTAAVVHNGAVPALAQLLSSPELETREQAAWCIGNILGDSPQLRDHALQFNLVPAMLQLIVLAEQSGADKVTALRTATWVLSNAFRGKPGPALDVVGPAIPYIAQLMHHADSEVKTDTLWSISYLCDGGEEKVDAFCQTGALQHVIQHLGHPDSKVVQPALRAVGNVAAGADRHTDLVVKSGVLTHVAACLAQTKASVRKETMWLLSNITAGTTEQIQAVLDAGLMPLIVGTGGNDCWDVRKEALWAVSNAAVGGSPAQLEAMANSGAIEFCVAACDNKTETAALVALLDGLKAFLKAGQMLENAGQENVFSRMVEEADGLTKLEALQEDANEEIYEKAVQIMTTFFDAEDAEEETQAAGAGFNFGAGTAFNFA